MNFTRSSQDKWEAEVKSTHWLLFTYSSLRNLHWHWLCTEQHTVYVRTKKWPLKRTEKKAPLRRRCTDTHRWAEHVLCTLWSDWFCCGAVDCVEMSAREKTLSGSRWEKRRHRAALKGQTGVVLAVQTTSLVLFQGSIVTPWFQSSRGFFRIF